MPDEHNNDHGNGSGDESSTETGVPSGELMEEFEFSPPDWYGEAYTVELSKGTLRALDECLSIRLSKTDSREPMYAKASGLRSAVRDVWTEVSREDDDAGELTLEGIDLSNLYGALFTVEFGSVPAAHDLDSLDLPGARSEFKDEMPADVYDHIELVEDGVRAMLDSIGPEGGGDSSE